MSMSPEIFSISVVVVLFGAIIGCYVWTFSAISRVREDVERIRANVNKCLKDVEQDMQNLEREASQEIRGFSVNLSDIAQEITNRLTALETIMNILEKQRHE